MRKCNASMSVKCVNSILFPKLTSACNLLPPDMYIKHVFSFILLVKFDWCLEVLEENLIYFLFFLVTLTDVLKSKSICLK